MRAPAAVALLAACALFGQQAPERTDTILRAMTDEIVRTKGLVVGDPAYYVEYQMEDADIFTASASLGAILSVNRNRLRIPQIDVRAGTYDFDNTNYAGSGFRGGVGGRWPTDDRYDVLRKYLWLGTDRAYKSALETLSRKRATLRNQTVSGPKLTDFSRVEPTRLVMPVGRLAIDEKAWTARVKTLSAIFRQYPVVRESSVEAMANYGTSYYVNTEGSVQRTPDPIYEVRIRAQAGAPDGTVIKFASYSLALEPSALPADEDLAADVKRVAGNLGDLAAAPPGESYSGPVLFEPRAAAQMFAQAIGDNVRASRRPVGDPGRPIPYMPGEFDTKIGSRVLPEWFDVVDDATKSEFAGRKLAGFYLVDSEGVRPTPVSLIEKGAFKTFLTTRQPVANSAASNGHARLPGNFGAHSPAISNLFVTASQTKPLSELKAQLIATCKERGKPYGIVVRELDYPSSMSFSELQQLAQSSQSGSRPLSPPVMVYRVYPDGREELVRGLRFRGFSSRSLRDILAASSESAVFEYLNNGAPFAISGIGGIIAPTSVVAPAVLFDELELERPQEGLSKPPIVPPPPIE